MSAATLRRLIVIALIALWEILPRAGLIPTLFLPSLSSTLAAGWNEAGDPTPERLSERSVVYSRGQRH